MSRFEPSVGERFIAKSPKYNEIAIHSIGHRLQTIVGIKRNGRSENIERITRIPCSLKMARRKVWKYAELQNDLTVK